MSLSASKRLSRDVNGVSKKANRQTLGSPGTGRHTEIGAQSRRVAEVGGSLCVFANKQDEQGAKKCLGKKIGRKF